MEEYIKLVRPNISNNSIKTYKSILTNLYKKVYPNKDTINIDDFNNIKDFSEYLNNVDAKQRKTYYSALLIISNDKIKDKYKSLMLNDIKEYNDFINLNKKNEKEKENWISVDNINNIRNEYKKNVSLLLKKNNLNMDDLQYIQQYIILCLYSYNEPRRLLDYTEMKNTKKNISDKDNYIDKNNF